MPYSKEEAKAKLKELIITMKEEATNNKYLSWTSSRGILRILTFDDEKGVFQQKDLDGFFDSVLQSVEEAPVPDGMSTFEESAVNEGIELMLTVIIDVLFEGI